MRRTRFPWCLSVAVLVAALLSISTTAVIAGTTGTTGATLHASGETVTVDRRNQNRFIPSTIENGGSEVFVGSGFGPGEVVSLYLTFPDGRVFPVMDNEGSDCCPQADETLADTTGGIHFEILFDQFQSYPTTTGSATDGTQFTNHIFVLPAEFATGAIPYGSYILQRHFRVRTALLVICSGRSATFVLPQSGP